MHRPRIIFVIATMILVFMWVLMAVLWLGLKNDGSHGRVPLPVPGSITTVHAPPTAQEVASSLHCMRFKDTFGGSPPALYTIDSGYCFIHGDKYAVNTFPSQDVRDSWLKLAEMLGTVPKWETATWVVYPSVKS